MSCCIYCILSSNSPANGAGEGAAVGPVTNLFDEGIVHLLGLLRCELLPALQLGADVALRADQLYFILHIILYTSFYDGRM